MIPENRHIIDLRMNKNDLEILIRGSEEIIPEDSFLEKIKSLSFMISSTPPPEGISDNSLTSQPYFLRISLAKLEALGR